jgi:hypothetical protein
MGLSAQWEDIGSPTLRAQGGEAGAAEGDSTGGPRPARSGRTAWPTLVIEAGYSQSMPQLHRHMQWWFSAPNHEVKIVLLVKFHPVAQQQRIVLEKWVETAQRETRRTPGLRPHLSQTITIYEEPANEATGTPATYTAVGGALRLEFRLLLLRAPGPGKGDIVVTVAQLEDYAARVWEANR